MSKAGSRMASPSLVISLIALFVALGGSAYAVKKVGTKELKNNAVTAAKIKKNAVTAAKIKKNAVTAAKLKDNTVTGAKIDESTLGSVPNAAHAASADQAANWGRYFTSGVKKANGNADVPLVTYGPFSFIGRCIDEGAGSYAARVLVTTSQPGSFLYSTEGPDYEAADFDPGIEVKVGYEAYGGSPWWAAYDHYYSGFTATNSDGSVQIEGYANSGVNVFGANCAFQVYGTSNA